MTNLTIYTPLLIKGTCITLAAWILASIVSLIIGIFLGIMSCQYFNFIKFTRFTKLYTFIAKGIPAYVYILIAYFVIPSIIGINISGFIAASMALAFSSSGYMTEIIRSGINTVPYGQWSACFTLGYPLSATLSRIIGPQALRAILPTLIGELEQLLKSTSLLATIGVTELTRTGMNIISRELNPIPIYGIIACIYLFFSAILYALKFLLERRSKAW